MGGDFGVLPPAGCGSHILFFLREGLECVETPNLLLKVSALLLMLNCAHCFPSFQFLCCPLLGAGFSDRENSALRYLFAFTFSSLYFESLGCNLESPVSSLRSWLFSLCLLVLVASFALGVFVFSF